MTNARTETMEPWNECNTGFKLFYIGDEGDDELVDEFDTYNEARERMLSISYDMHPLPDYWRIEAPDGTRAYDNGQVSLGEVMA